MQRSKLNLEISATGPGCDLAFFLDGSSVWSGPVTADPQQVVVEFDDFQEAQHELIMVMSGKTRRHTRLNEQGDIVEDLLVTVKPITLDGINIDNIVTSLAEYHHDFNGTQAPVVEKFYGHMGCNGTLKLHFTTPVYLWLLENM